MIDLGDPWPNLSVTIYNAAGVPENATAVVLTITLPDGTTATPSVTAAGSGVYTASYTPTLPGRYSARWVATGTNASAYTDAIDVDEAAPTGIVSLADTKSALGITTTTNDEKLRRYIDAATDFIESRIGPVVRRTITQVVTPSRDGTIFLDGPVLSLTSMTDTYGYGYTYNVANYLPGADGTVTPLANVSSNGHPVTVTYVGGRAIVPALIQQAAFDYIRWMWETQRGATALPAPGGDDFEVAAPATVPYRILQALEPYTLPVVA